MRHTRRDNRFFRRAELPRLASAIILLTLVCALMYRSRDPHMWAWLTTDGSSDSSGSEKNGQPSNAATDPVTSLPTGPQTPDPINENTEPREDEQGEAERLKGLLEVVTDGTLWLHKREMPAYWQILTKVRKRTLESLQSEARSGVKFNDLFSSPRAHRGQLVKIDLNVRRVIKAPVEKDNSAGIEQLYELWGPSDETKAWPFVAVTPDLPPGMPVAENVEERVTVVGYFFKLQGYQAAASKPNSRPLVAPLLIGKIVWHGQPPRQAAESGWFDHLFVAGLVLAGVLLGARILFALRPGKKTPKRENTDKSENLRDWFRDSQIAKDNPSSAEPGDRPVA
jgi:hypothetical protein